MKFESFISFLFDLIILENFFLEVGLSNMLKILINSYTCCPDMGSEQGMGWNWITSLARYCVLFVITEGEYRPQIEAWLADSKNAELARNMHFYWNPIGRNESESQRIRKMCWNQGDWRFYKYYKEWQKKTAEIAEAICQKEKIDLLHQLNMIGFREPGCLWQVSKKTGIPFVWGPIGGLKQFPLAYACGAGLKMRVFNFVKNKINSWQIAHDRRVSAALQQASLLISSIPDSYNAIKRYHNLESVVIPETGCFSNDFLDSFQGRFKGSPLEILWVGKFDFRKRLDIALKSIAKLSSNVNVRLKVCGSGSENQIFAAEQLTLNLKIQDRIDFMGSCSHDTVVDLMKMSDLFFFTSVSEDTSTVVLEAISCGLPILCFDACGMSAVVDDSVGMKIPLTNPEQSINDFAQAITHLYNDRKKLAEISANCRKRAVELSWENKALQVLELYKSAVLTSKKELHD